MPTSRPVSKKEGANVISIYNIEVAAEKLGYYLDRLKVITEHSTHEPGLVRCEIFAEASQPNKLTIVDVFEDQDAYLDHMHQNYVGVFAKEVSDCAVGEPVHRILQLVGRGKNLVELVRPSSP